MKLNFIFISVCLFIWILGYLLYRLWKKDISLNYKVVITILTFVKICLIVSIIFAFKSYKINKNKIAPIGNKGERGLRGDSGKNAECSTKCSNNLCGKILLKYVTSIYNEWRFSNGLEKIPEGKLFENKFLKNKINQMCKSKNYKKLLARDGAGKIDEYLKKIWKEWITIILKYENGVKFMDTPDLIDTDFDSLITEKDKKFATFSNQGTDGTPSKGEESPFDELKKYDVWYWGSNPLLKPKLVNVCKKDANMGPELKVKESNDYYDNLWESRNSRQIHYQRWRRQIICIPVGLWPVCFPICVKDGKHYVSGLQKGSSHVTAYKNKDYVDKKGDVYKPIGDIILPGSKYSHNKNNSECLPEKIDKEELSDKCFRDKGIGNPSQKNILVSGNVKNPVSYKPLFMSLRKRGHNANNQGVQFWRPIPPKGYKCLGDIVVNNSNNSMPSTDLINCVPEKCVRRNKNYKKIYSTRYSPNDRCRSSRMCCGKETSGRNRDTDFVNYYGEAEVYTDKYNNFRARNPEHQDDNGKFYEIIPLGEEGDSGQGSCLEERVVNKGKKNIKNQSGESNACSNYDMDDSSSYNNNNWIVPEKKDKKYSILNVYNN